MSDDWWSVGDAELRPPSGPRLTAAEIADRDVRDQLDRALGTQLNGFIQQMRALLSLSQQQLADLAGVERSVVSRFERRARNPSWATFQQLLAAMGYLPKVNVLARDEVIAAKHRRRVRYMQRMSLEWGGGLGEEGEVFDGTNYRFLKLGAEHDSVAESELTDSGLTSLGDVVQREPGFETIAIHAGQEPDPLTGAVVPAIYQVSTFAQDGVGGLRGGYEYSRSANPTRTALEQCLAGIEAADTANGGRGFAFASGLASEDALVRAVCKPGDHVVIPGDAYGGTYRLFARVLSEWGVSWTAVMQDDPGAVKAAMQDNTKIVWCETPTNPLLTVADIAALRAVAHDGGALLAVDNTFASAYLQQPLTLGADVVMHSTTKYLGGHSDVVGGALVCSDGELAEKLAFIHNATGAVAGPFDAWLVLRGIKTLAVRMERHCDNAEAIVAMLRENPAVKTVLYPDTDLVAQKQMRRFGGMVSFRIAGDAAAAAEKAVEICGRTRIFTLAESLGGVESLIEHPGRMTHASAAGSQLEVPADLVRLSVGLESAPDLIADLEQALS